MFKNQSDITEALQNKINQLAASGGGEIRIPPGEYHFRPIELKSNICLNLSAGTKMIASPRREDYFPIGYDHNEMGQVHSALYALDAENITLKGEGTIDLNGEAFYHMDKPKPVVPITKAMKEGRDPMRTFGDLQQFWQLQQTESQPEKEAKQAKEAEANQAETKEEPPQEEKESQ